MFAKKIVLGLSASAAVMAQDVNRNTLVTMMDFYNNAWDVSTNYWVDYGCNCRSDLDRTSNGYGRAVDDLDQTCKTWKQCMKCAGCDDVNASKYIARKRRGQYYCRDDVGTCERALCECDIQFAKTEEHTSELQSHSDLVCRLLLEKKKKKKQTNTKKKKKKQKKTKTKQNKKKNIQTPTTTTKHIPQQTSTQKKNTQQRTQHKIHTL